MTNMQAQYIALLLVLVKKTDATCTLYNYHNFAQGGERFCVHKVVKKLMQKRPFSIDIFICSGA